MSRIAIKICGLSTPETLDAAIGAGASHVGFVHFAKSPRHVEAEQLAALARRVPGHVAKVGVMVEPEDALLDLILRAGSLDAVQLHGKEPPERVAALRARFPQIRFWKAVPVKTAADIAAADRYRDAADLILFDARTPDGADLPGGMGLRFDWTLLQGRPPAGPWGLSGGLDPANVGQAIRLTGAPLVDISSGVESAPGIKDVDKIVAFCNAVLQC
ncbi:N-(5'-phosphoribosyl)anthranilate isomerase [Sphingobium jiangsuense]|uniref:N-(5'-phosphoribosyl)anthranilate isomerase n=1 Tax=Sphingobium jiangsuense TaxID=870476 RepID=A0A7W6FNT6_9SPHN|nr:phosphoribosylanthranilate isomerase [Sphingobium jiangsuense]MBB3925421.1 phosphoribosylanthranilate isomerase [Sphingobium jiangsuense]GLT01965.1 N-(5'-phosphoribosyl)anthranilate isomerase [Sphingobium jiangsuense]